jgi:alpha-mannosidase
MMGDGSGEGNISGTSLHKKDHPIRTATKLTTPIVLLQEATGQTFTPIEQRQRSFGPSWSTHWFKIIVTVPDDLEALPAVFQWDMDSEGLVWSTDGTPLQGLTGGCKCDM